MTRLVKTGVPNATYGDLASGTIFDISGVGNTFITGRIGIGVVINKSGVGNLYIQGPLPTAPRALTLNKSGVGNVYFSTPPSAGTLVLKQSGVGQVHGLSDQDLVVREPVSSRVSFGNVSIGGLQVSSSVSITNGRVFIGGKEVTPERDEFSQDVMEYKASLEKREIPLSVLLDSMHDEKNQEYMGLHAKYTDCITKEWCDIPVRLHGRVYDLSTITKLVKQEDPITRRLFRKIEVQEAHDIVSELDAFVNGKNKTNKRKCMSVDVHNPSKLVDQKCKEGGTADRECLICTENIRLVVNIGCGHKTLCLACATDKMPKQCPTCRTDVTSWLATTE